jgi:hypothetical protein
MEVKIVERTSNQPTFLESLTSNLGGPRTAEFFHKCDKMIPWNEEILSIVVDDGVVVTRLAP